MRTSHDHILTSHAGSLPRPDDLIEANRARDSGQTADDRRFQDHLKAAVADVVSQQKVIGIDVPGDGDEGREVGAPARQAWARSCSRASRTGVIEPSSWRSTRILTEG